MLKDRRARDRDRLARQTELQRNTLLELQGALRELSDAAFRVWATALHSTSDDAEERERQIEEARLPMDLASAKVKLLASRVEDDETRNLAAAFVRVANRVDTNDERADEAMDKIQRAYSVAIDRIGELIRERY